MKDETTKTDTAISFDELRAEIMPIIAAALAVDGKLVADWIRVLEAQDAFGCFTDPTAWMQTGNARAVSLKMLRAFAAFKAELERSNA